MASTPSELRVPMRKAGLVHSSDADPGYTRRRCGRGFVYLGLRGTRLFGKRTLRRIEDLVIPPAWEEVWICRNPRGHLQATGRDERKRKQYLYHADWEEVRNRTKFDMLLQFAEALPRIRSTVRRDLRREELSRRKVLALAVRILDETLIRVGNEFYADANRSYGLTTLRDRHFKEEDDGAVFRFPGKSGRKQEVVLEDQRLVDLVSACQDLPGQELFQYTDEEGEVTPVRSEDVNDYLQSISGDEITAKVFRTWGATVEAAKTLAEEGPPNSKSDIRHRGAAAARRVAELLGNTPAVARNSYIAPAVFEAFERGTLCDFMSRTRSTLRNLTAAEQGVVELLKHAAAGGRFKLAGAVEGSSTLSHHKGFSTS